MTFELVLQVTLNCWAPRQRLGGHSKGCVALVMKHGETFGKTVVLDVVRGVYGEVGRTD